VRNNGRVKMEIYYGEWTKEKGVKKRIERKRRENGKV